MILIVGLGNPGKKFEKTRHNLGFRIVDEFAKKNKFPSFKISKKFLTEISEGSFDEEKIILAKPQTFVNNSGRAVKSLTKKYKLKTINLFVVHDDIDLPLGKIRISVGRSAAGHKGVQSIIDTLGTEEFVRFRIGIKPQETRNKKQETEKFVLKKFTKTEKEIIKKTIEKTLKAVILVLKQGLEKAMNEYNK